MVSLEEVHSIWLHFVFLKTKHTIVFVLFSAFRWVLTKPRPEVLKMTIYSHFENFLKSWASVFVRSQLKALNKTNTLVRFYVFPNTKWNQPERSSLTQIINFSQIYERSLKGNIYFIATVTRTSTINRQKNKVAYGLLRKIHRRSPN